MQKRPPLPRKLLSLMRRAGSDLSRVEVKSARGGFPRDALKTISAFANTSGGTLILGLSEEHGFAPVDGFDPKAMLDALSNACREGVNPPINAEVDLREYGDAVIVVAEIPEIRPDEKPCYIANGHMYGSSYVRVGDGDKRMTDYEAERLREERRQPSYDTDIVPDATVDDLNNLQVDSLLSREREFNPLVFGQLDKEAALKALRVLREDDSGTLRPTLAGLLSLGIYPQSFFPRLGVTFVAFPGPRSQPILSNERYLDAREIGGSIPVMVAETLAAIRRNTKTSSVIEGAFRRDVPEYPVEAAREAIANALMHRDYSPSARGGQVQVNLYADCLEITNPGGLFGSVTVDSIGTPGVSSTRNQFLSRLLSSTPYPSDLGGAKYVVENKGTGFLEICRTLTAAHMSEPSLYDSPGRFTLVFSRRQSIEGGPAGTPPLRESILQLVKARGLVGAREIQEICGYSRATVNNRIKELVDEGVLEATEPPGNKRRRYRLAQNQPVEESQ